MRIVELASRAARQKATVGSSKMLDPRWITATVAVIAAFVALWQWRSKKALDLRSAALQYSLTRNQKYLDARRVVTDWFSSHPDISKLAVQYHEENHGKNEKTNPNTYTNNPIQKYQDGKFDKINEDARFLLAHWEIMAIAILNECVDERVCFEMVGTTLKNTVVLLRPFIDDLRSQPTDRRRYDYLLILEDSWRRRLESERSTVDGQGSSRTRKMAPVVIKLNTIREEVRLAKQDAIDFFKPTVPVNSQLSRYEEYLHGDRSIRRMRRKLFLLWEAW